MTHLALVVTALEGRLSFRAACALVAPSGRGEGHGRRGRSARIIRAGQIVRLAIASWRSVQAIRFASWRASSRSHAHDQWIDTTSPGSGTSMNPVASRHAWTRSRRGGPMPQSALDAARAGGRHDQLVADPVEDAAPPDPAGVHDLQDAVDPPAADEPDAREDVEDVERVDRLGAVDRAWSPASASPSV